MLMRQQHFLIGPGTVTLPKPYLRRVERMSSADCQRPDTEFGGRARPEPDRLVRTSATPIALSVTSGKFINIVPKFPRWENGDNNSTYLIR